MNIHRQSLLGLMLLVMLVLVACGGESSDDATLTFEQALSATQTVIAFQAELAIALQATETANLQATQQAQRLPSVTRNEDWTPVEREFDGVVMVLVPPGCFMMGSTDEQIDEALNMFAVQQGGAVSNVRSLFEAEAPQHEQCFDEPFWIDKYEVTQAQFAQFGGQKAYPNNFTGDNLPVGSITWFEARDFCELRGGRLPTEREWEYATRGPNNLIYPWGNEFVANNVVYDGNSNVRTASVGSREGGASWVGALDLAGNVAEWVSGSYEPYPYDSDDGREHNTGDDTSILRVLRGGSWDNLDVYVRASYRNTGPTGVIDADGFRCSRSYP